MSLAAASSRSDDSSRSMDTPLRVVPTPSAGVVPDAPVLHRFIRQRRFTDAIHRLEDPGHRAEARAVDPATGELPLLVALRIKVTPLALVEHLLDAFPYDEVMMVLKGGTISPLDDGEVISGKQSNFVAAEGSPLFVAVKHGLSVQVVEKLVTVSGIDRLRDDINRDKQVCCGLSCKVGFPFKVICRQNIACVCVTCVEG